MALLSKKQTRCVLSFSPNELADQLGVLPYRGRQLYEWLRKGVRSFDEMKNLPGDLRAELSSRWVIENYHIVEKQVSVDGTIKVLGRFLDGSFAEAVLMKYQHGISVCISTQVGCKVGCVFCASGKEGFFRNITAGEMFGQMLALQQFIPQDERISHVVLMGSGEPMDNLEQVLTWIQRIEAKELFSISLRSITVSTSGLVSPMRQFADKRKPVTLAVSLHNPFQKEREKIIPTAISNPIDQIIDVANYYFDQTGRRITYEYVLISGENDTDNHALELIRLLKGKNCHVNLIPMNTVAGENYIASHARRVVHFESLLSQGGIQVTIRKELGADIDAACGQLKNKYRPDRKTIVNIK